MEKIIRIEDGRGKEIRIRDVLEGLVGIGVRIVGWIAWGPVVIGIRVGWVNLSELVLCGVWMR